MPADDGGIPQHSPVGSRAEQHVIDDKIDLKSQLKTTQKERDGRWRTYALVLAFLAGFVACDLSYGGKITHRLLVKIDRWVHPNPYYDEE